MRAATLLCKVFLQHLTPLLLLEDFTSLWLQILDFLDKYMHHSDRSELLIEAIPESLKNLLLVMETAGIFHTPDGYTKLWAITWEKIDSFLPTLRAELIRSVPPGKILLVIIICSLQYSNSVQFQFCFCYILTVDQIISTPQAPESALSLPEEQQREEHPLNLNLSLINANPPTDFVPVVFAHSEPELNQSSSPPLEESTALPKEAGETEAVFPLFISNGVSESENSVVRATSPALSASGRIEYTSICFGDEEEEVETKTTPHCVSE